jgi:hypothetical protein
MAKTIAVQRAYHAGNRGIEYAERVQTEAERLALIEGNPEEAKRRRNAGIDLAKKQRASGDVFLLPSWLVRDLGGPRDTIAYLIKQKELTVIHGRAALSLREHTEGVTISISGNGEFGVFVEGGQDGGMEAHCDKRFVGIQAWRLALGAVEPATVKAVQRVINGHAGLKQARRLIGGENNAAHTMLKANLIKALDAANAYLGASG